MRPERPKGVTRAFARTGAEAAGDTQWMQSVGNKRVIPANAGTQTRRKEEFARVCAFSWDSTLLGSCFRRNDNFVSSAASAHPTRSPCLHPRKRGAEPTKAWRLSRPKQRVQFSSGDRWFLHGAVRLSLPALPSSACYALANRKFPVRPHKVASVPVRIALEIILMLRLGFPERSSGGNLCHDFARPQP